MKFASVFHRVGEKMKDFSFLGFRDATVNFKHSQVLAIYQSKVIWGKADLVTPNPLGNHEHRPH